MRTDHIAFGGIGQGADNGTALRGLRGTPANRDRGRSVTSRVGSELDVLANGFLLVHARSQALILL